MPYCPFCGKLCATGGIKDHIRAKHDDRFKEWVNHGQLPYWRYDNDGNLKVR